MTAARATRGEIAGLEHREQRGGLVADPFAVLVERLPFPRRTALGDGHGQLGGSGNGMPR